MNTVWSTTAADPPSPLVLAEELLCPADTARRLLAERGLHRLVGQVFTTTPTSTAADRAQAAALATSWRIGILARATAAWVWAGDCLPAPAAIDLGAASPAVQLTSMGVVSSTSLRTVQVRCTLGSEVVRIGGVAVTGPLATASECARLLPAPLAADCIVALDRSGAVGLQTLERHLRGQVAARGRRRGALLLEQLIADGSHRPEHMPLAAA